MLTDLKAAMNRNPVALAQDFAGGAALAVVMIGALFIPGLI